MFDNISGFVINSMKRGLGSRTNSSDRKGSRTGFGVSAPNIKHHYTSPGSLIQEPDQGYNNEAIDQLKYETAYSAFESIRKDILKGRDPRGTIITRLADPDAIGGQIER